MDPTDPPWEVGSDSASGDLTFSVGRVSVTRTSVDTSPSVFRTIPQRAFSVGEKITFSVRFMGIPCGELTMTVAEQIQYNGRPVYVVHAHASTNRAFAMFYTVSDTLTSFIDSDGLFSWKYVKEIHETKDDKIQTVEYNQVQGTWSVDGETMGTILPFTQDLLSTFYHLRAADWSAGHDTISAPLNDTKKNYMMRFELGKRKRMHTILDWVEARVGRPILELDGKYKQIGHTEVWFTDDTRRIPVMIGSKILLGSFYAKLVKYVPGAGDLAATK